MGLGVAKKTAEISFVLDQLYCYTLHLGLRTLRAQASFNSISSFNTPIVSSKACSTMVHGIGVFKDGYQKQTQ
jgi:hypothetical protein